MADCHFRHECEEFYDYEGEVDCLNKLKGCSKNPGNENFQPVSDLTMEDVPSEFQTDEGMRCIQYLCNRTVKIHSSYTSVDRPDTWYGSDHPYPYCDFKGNNRLAKCGTGFIYRILYKHEPCLCEECEKPGQTVTGYMEVMVYTARHVIYDDSEAVKTRVECFYDRPDRAGVGLLYGVSSSWHSYEGPDSDRITAYCVTHNKDLIYKLNQIMIKQNCSRFGNWSRMELGFTVSHPHGVHKHISFGHPHFYVYSISKDHFPKHPGFVKCRLKHPPSTQNSLAPISRAWKVFGIVGKFINFVLQQQVGRLYHCNYSPLLLLIFQLCRTAYQKIFRHIFQQPLTGQEGSQYDKNKIYLESVKCPSVVEPGIEYLLPITSNICVPSYHRRVWDWGLDIGWRDIPEGSGYVDSTGKLVHFPQGMEICCQFEHYFTSTYEIPTCPGSSGAHVVIDQYGGSFVDSGCVHLGVDQFLGNKGFYRFFWL